MSRHLPKQKQAMIDQLSRDAFGETLAQGVAAQLVKENHERGGLYHDHRDYCGHGLIYRDGAFILASVRDGWPEQSKHLATWDSPEAFIAFLAKQSDYTCSGADESATVFYTDDDWELNNQRLTEAWLKDYAAGKCPTRLPPA